METGESMTWIEIDQELCTGCRACAQVCPAYAIEGEEGEPQRINAERCVMCGQCVQKCKSYLSLWNGGFDTYEQKRAARGLPQTVREPLFAAHYLCRLHEIEQALAEPENFVVVHAAPSVRVGIAEDFGMPLGSLAPGKLAAALRKLGFARVYDTDFAADLTIVEEAAELVSRIQRQEGLPMFTSCCPAWVRFLENSYPGLTKHLSTCKSPQQMQGAIVKTYGALVEGVQPSRVVNVSVMPCTCKSYESGRAGMSASGFRDIDHVMTTRELAYLIKQRGIDFRALTEEEFDKPLGTYTGAGALFGVTGGVMESAIRTASEQLTGQPPERVEVLEVLEVRGTEGVRTATIRAGALELKVGVVCGLKNAVPIVEKLRAGKLDLQFIEVMSCPQGCVSGGGQPKLLLESNVPEAYARRRESLLEHDCNLPLRRSHENPAITKLYEDFLGEPNGSKAHELLHLSEHE